MTLNPHISFIRADVFVGLDWLKPLLGQKLVAAPISLRRDDASHLNVLPERRLS
jgi:hypothetical protein